MEHGLSKVFIGNSKTSVEQTLLRMKELIIKSDTDDKERLVKSTAKNIVAAVPTNDYLGQIKHVVGWVRRNLRYCRDIYGVEELTSPYRVLYNIQAGKNTHSSDCDDFAMLIAALLRSLGFRTRLEAVAVMSPRYDHARTAVFIGGDWCVIEGTKNVPVGYAQKSRLPTMYVEVI